jgi:hypothetical protein
LERVNGMTGQSASASFVFGESYGQLTMGLIACGILGYPFKMSDKGF